jgi:LemA protein
MQSFFDMIWGLIELVVFLAVVIAMIALWSYNKLRAPSENVKEAWANVTIAARKKVAMVNQLADVAKSYQDNEKLMILKLSEDSSVAGLQAANAQTGNILATINGMAQRFPNLKADTQYTNLAAAVAKCENDLEMIRNRYNAMAKQYNVLRTSVPHVFYAGLLGFRTAPYLTMDALEGPDQTIQKPLVSDDGERVQQLLNKAGAGALSAAKSLVDQGKLLAEKGAARAQAASNGGSDFTYLDAEKNPQGPISRAELDSLVQSGTITPQTSVLKAGTKSWVKYADL